MSALERILSQQRRWAIARGVRVDASDRVLRLEDNLFRPLSPLTRQDFNVGGGFELQGDMRSLRSTAALACNVFEVWRPRGLDPVLAVCGGDRRASRLSFERSFATGLRRQPARAAVVLDGNGAVPTAIDCSFLESYDVVSNDFSAGYFESDESWRGLGRSRALAREMASGGFPYRKLRAARLLKLALGLTREYGVGGFRLLTLWYDSGCSEAAAHAKELDEFGRVVSGDFDFAYGSWQDLYASLRGGAPGQDEHIAYLGDRYFDQPR